MEGIFLSLGSNLGDVVENLARARQLLREKGVSIAAASSEVITPAWGIENQDDFLNQVLEVDFLEDFVGEREPYVLLDICQQVEREMGKVMPGDAGYVRWGPRLIDIDILIFDDLESWDPDLRLPHHTIEKEYVKELLGELS